MILVKPLAATVVLTLGVGVGAVTGSVGSTGTRAHAAASGGTWHQAVTLSGTVPVVEGLQDAALASISCRAVGDCSAVGTWSVPSELQSEGLVATESDGTWGRGHWVAKFPQLNVDGVGALLAVSCGAVGYCLAGGDYFDANSNGQAVEVAEYDGTWGRAMSLPGSISLNAGGNALISDVSCPSKRSCTVAGTYEDAAGDQQPFVATETNGSWTRAEELPGIASLEAGSTQQFVQVASLSCGAPGNCAVGGYFQGTTYLEAYVASESGGVWSHAIVVPGTAPTSAGEDDAVRAISCSGPGTCTAVGYVGDATGSEGTAFVANEVHGAWQDAAVPPGSAGLAGDGFELLTGIDCSSQKDCSATGLYYNTAGMDAVVATESNGVWASARSITTSPGVQVQLGQAEFDDLSCGAPGDCSAVGNYLDENGDQQALLDVEVGGVWEPAVNFPGVEALNTGANVENDGADAGSVACTGANACSAVGVYTEADGVTGSFVASETPG